MMKKSFYEAPEAELLLVKFEENFCGTTGGGFGDTTANPDDQTEEDWWTNNN